MTSHILRAGVAAALFAVCSGLFANPAHHPDKAEPASPSQPAGAPATAQPAIAPMDPISLPPAPPSVPPGAPGMAGGGMGGMMGDMMGRMTGPEAAGPIYPSLMTLPSITPEKYAEISALANQQMKEGTERHAKGQEALLRAAQVGDHAAMQQSVGLMREGLDQLSAGIAGHRVLLDGKAPRNLALGWFKREMNLASPISHPEPFTVLGVTPLHLLTMLLLVAFALAMLAMYVFKMRRTAALFGRIEGGAGPPPPGSAPPLAGTPAPPASHTPNPAE